MLNGGVIRYHHHSGLLSTYKYEQQTLQCHWINRSHKNSLNKSVTSFYVLICELLSGCVLFAQELHETWTAAWHSPSFWWWGDDYLLICYTWKHSSRYWWDWYMMAALLMSRDHSFLRNTEFWAEPQNLSISAEFLCFQFTEFCGIRYWPVI